MNRNPLTWLLFAGALMLTSLHADEWRDFTSALGQRLTAKVLVVRGDVVTLERRDGRQVAIEFKDLSEEDVAWLSEWEEGKTMPKEDDKPESADEEDDEAEKEAPPEKPALPASGEMKKAFYPRTKEEIEKTLEEILAREIPEGIDEAEGIAVNRLNAYRYLCGVSYDVEGDIRMNEQAEEAAKACDAHGSLSHDLGHYTNICNLSGGPDIVFSVESYMNDNGPNNREARGHRRWCLNPPMGKVGFGGGTKFAAMACMDGSGKGRSGDTWGYPHKGFFPLSYLHGDAWSLYLRGEAPDKDSLEVDVFRLSSRPEKPFTWAEKEPGEKLEVVWVSTTLNSINFEPKGAYVEGVYWVRIRGGGVREQYLVELY
jgi:hypothetical protein